MLSRFIRRSLAGGNLSRIRLKSLWNRTEHADYVDDHRDDIPTYCAPTYRAPTYRAPTYRAPEEIEPSQLGQAYWGAPTPWRRPIPTYVSG